MRPVLVAVLLTACFGASAQTVVPGDAMATEVASPASVGPFVTTPGVEYLYDDGTANVNIGPPSSFSPDMLWGNYYVTAPGGETITEIAVAFGATFPSVSGGVTFWLLDDPDADGDPRNATAVASAEATPDVFGNTFYHVAIPPTPVSGAFFVGASAQLAGGQDRPARVDTGARADRSWFFYAPDIAAVIDTLAAAPFGTRMDDATNVPFPGAFMVRAHGRPGGTTTTEVPPPVGLVLDAAPNPVSGTATVRFDLPAASAVTVDVLDALGRHVATLAEGDLAAGPHAVRWDTRAVPPGVYVCRVRVGASARSVRVVVAP
jgi:hypothetical protein